MFLLWASSFPCFLPNNYFDLRGREREKGRECEEGDREGEGRGNGIHFATLLRLSLNALAPASDPITAGSVDTCHCAGLFWLYYSHKTCIILTADCKV